MGQSIAYVRSGYIQTFSNGALPNDQRVWIPYAQRDDTRTKTVKRARPVGVNQLFNGTAVISDRKSKMLFPKIDVASNPIATTVTYTVIQPGTLGTQPLSDIPDVYWGNKLRGQIRDADINLAQSFAERGQCEKMFVSYGKRILRAYTFARKGNVSGVLNSLLGTTGKSYQGWRQTVKDTTGVASDTWLAWQYGIRPLISDLQGAVSEYWKVRAASPVIRSFKFSVSNDTRFGGVLIDVPSGTRATTYLVQKAKIVAHAEFQDSAQAWDQSAQRLGLTDPLLLGWELIPYSFVIDWFINVGDFLQASGTFAGLKRIGITVTTRTTEVSTNAQGNGHGVLRRTLVSRQPKSLPNAVLRIKSSPLSVSHVTSALALIRQVRF
jgi:hypothetical protein